MDLCDFLFYLCCALKHDVSEVVAKVGIVDFEEMFLRQMQDILQLYQRDPVNFVSEGKIDVIDKNVLEYVTEGLKKRDYGGLHHYFNGLIADGRKNLLYPFVLMFSKATMRHTRLTCSDAKHLNLTDRAEFLDSCVEIDCDCESLLCFDKEDAPEWKKPWEWRQVDLKEDRRSELDLIFIEDELEVLDEKESSPILSPIKKKKKMKIRVDRHLKENLVLSMYDMMVDDVTKKIVNGIRSASNYQISHLDRKNK